MYSLNVTYYSHFYRLYLAFFGSKIPYFICLTLSCQFFYTEWLFLSIGVFFKKRMILSGIVLLIGITFINKFYKFLQKNIHQMIKFTVMSYNVRLIF
jgi:hypothetical protein